MYETKRRMIDIEEYSTQDEEYLNDRDVDTTYRYIRLTKSTISKKEVNEIKRKKYLNNSNNYRVVKIGKTKYIGSDRKPHHTCENDCKLITYCHSIKCMRHQTNHKPIIFI